MKARKERAREVTQERLLPGCLRRAIVKARFLPVYLKRACLPRKWVGAASFESPEAEGKRF